MLYVWYICVCGVCVYVVCVHGTCMRCECMVCVHVACVYGMSVWRICVSGVCMWCVWCICGLSICVWYVWSLCVCCVSSGTLGCFRFSAAGSCSCIISCETVSFLSGLEVAPGDLCMPDKPWTTKLCPTQKALL